MSVSVVLSKKKIRKDLSLMKKAIFLLRGNVQLAGQWINLLFYSWFEPGLVSIFVQSYEEVMKIPDMPAGWVERVEITFDVAPRTEIALKVSTVTEAKEVIRKFQSEGEQGLAGWPSIRTQRPQYTPPRLPDFCCHYHAEKFYEEDCDIV